jgi:hypothetical protein
MLLVVPKSLAGEAINLDHREVPKPGLGDAEGESARAGEELNRVQDAAPGTSGDAVSRHPASPLGIPK